jgi:hypothetical protein
MNIARIFQEFISEDRIWLITSNLLYKNEQIFVQIEPLCYSGDMASITTHQDLAPERSSPPIAKPPQENRLTKMLAFRMAIADGASHYLDSLEQVAPAQLMLSKTFSEDSRVSFLENTPIPKNTRKTASASHILTRYSEIMDLTELHATHGKERVIEIATRAEIIADHLSNHFEGVLKGISLQELYIPDSNPHSIRERVKKATGKLFNRPSKNSTDRDQ